MKGQQFGRWSVTNEDHVIVHKQAYWLCICECGTRRFVAGQNLRNGKSLSCGCLAVERHPNKGGWSNHPLYQLYCSMIKRCENSRSVSYKWYGARGITVCKRWRKSFGNFLQDMGERPSPEHSLDRKRNDGPYSPENCRWATARDQRMNQRRHK